MNIIDRVNKWSGNALIGGTTFWAACLIWSRFVRWCVEHCPPDGHPFWWME